ncbi:MAG: glycosyltransferase family 4 protein [Candidatus Uhrbacteria bacterium]|nr:glycosyltransferase family 4 protein [Candidatus Uhrbacteria bacterium]
MLIGIDASRANKPKKTGVEWYAFHLIEELKKLTVGDKHQWALYTREPLTGDLAVLPENWYEVRAGWWPKYLWTQARMSWEMMRRPADVLFVPAHVLPPIRPEKSVVTIHDVGFHRMPHLYNKRQRLYHEATTKDIVRTGARIITVSEFCGREIVELYGADPANIAITHLGIDHGLYHPMDEETIHAALTKYRIPDPYFMMIGRMEEKKNVVSIVKAFDALKAQRGVGDPTVLVLCGPKGFGYEKIKAAIEASPNRAQIVELGYVPESDVPALVAGARGYVHVAWYEGFGIPLVQAMACGCPVIAANNSCLPEVVGEGNGIFVKPDDIDAIAVGMERLLSDPSLVADFRARGIERAKKFTWAETAKQTLPVLTDWIG